MHYLFKFFILAIALVAFHACKNDTNTTTTEGTDLLNIPFQHTYFAHGSNGRIWKSDTLDPPNWQSVDSGTTYVISAMIHAHSRYWFTSGNFPPNDSGFIKKSIDGRNWINVVTGFKKMNGMIYGNKRFVAYGDDGGDNRTYTSLDGINWNTHTVPSGLNNATFNIKSVAYGNGRFVLVGGFSTNAETAWSNDGINWTMTSPATANTFLNDVVFGNNKFVGVSKNGTIFLSNDNGNSWGTNILEADHFNSIVFANNTFILVGNNGSIWRSNDGINWQDVSFGINNLLGAAFLNGQFIATGINGTVMISRFGFKWKNVGPGGSDALNGISIPYK